jgi:hypothetical protein
MMNASTSLSTSHVSGAKIFINQLLASARSRQVQLYAGLLAANIALIWLLPYFPSQDGPMHIYNLVVLRDLLHHRGSWQGFYAPNIELRAAPNLGFHLLAYPLLSFLPPLAVERVICSLYILVLGISVPTFLKAFGRPVFPVSFLTFVAMFSRPLLLGMYNNALGTALLPLGLAALWKLRFQPVRVKALGLNLVGLALFLVHFVPFAIFFLAAAANAALTGHTRREQLRGLARFLAIVSPLLLLIGLFASAQAHHFGTTLPSLVEHPKLTARMTSLVPTSSRTGLAHVSLVSRFCHSVLDLASFSGLSFSLWHILPGMGALCLLLIGLFQARWQSWSKTVGEEDSSCNPRFLSILCIGLVILYAVAPVEILGAGLFNLRLPTAILLISLPLINSDGSLLSGRNYSRALSLLAIATLFVNATVLWNQSSRVAEFVRGVEAPIPPGSTILTANYEPRLRLAGMGWIPDPLIHASSYYGLHGTVDMDNNEARLPYFMTRALQPAPQDLVVKAYKDPRSFDWNDLPQVQYLLCWKMRDEDSVALAPQFSLFWKDSGTSVTVWKRR